MVIWQNKTVQYRNTAVKYQMKAKGAPWRVHIPIATNTTVDRDIMSGKLF